jgi:hypothetical protein
MNNSQLAPGAVWPGSTIDWKSSFVSVKLYVELPFWMMMPEGVFEVNHGGSTATIEVVHACEEIQSTPTDQTTHSSTVFIARPNERPPDWVESVVENPNGFSVRIHRTTLVFEPTVLDSVLSHLQEGNRLNRNQAYTYLQALALGHLALVNHLLAAYRRVSYDPFVLEVTAPTVPIWFYRIGDRFIRVSLWPYANLLHRPEWSAGGRTETVDLATSEEIREYLTLPETPGETILLDAWSYFYEGRFNDAVRALVTAIEVLLESKYAEALRAHGAQEDKVNAELNSSSQKFLTRLTRYLDVSGRTVPGPLLSCVPYINGVRLRDELQATRRLRHKIVHEGERISPFAFGVMLKNVETMTWLFNWLEDNQRNSGNRFRHYAFKSALKGGYYLAVDYTEHGLRVREAEFGPPADPDTTRDGERTAPSPLLDDILWDQYTSSLFGNRKDLPLFAKMAMTCVICGSTEIVQATTGLNSGTLADNDPPFPEVGVIPERFNTKIDDLETAIFIVDLDGEMDLRALNGVLIRMLQLRVQNTDKRVHGICIVNQQRHLAPVMREACRTVEEDMRRLLESCDITVVLTTDLARYIKGALEFGWNLHPIREAMKVGGFTPCEPPNALYIGEVIRVFPKRSVIGINVDVEPPLQVGDKIAIRSDAGFEVLEVASISVNKELVRSAAIGEIGVKVKFDVKRIIDGSFVYRIRDPELHAI